MDKVKFGKYITCLCAVSVALLAVTLIPMVIIGFYTHPLGDDYYYGVPAAVALRNGEGLWGAFLAAFKGTAEQYRIWQGTYSAMLLMHLPPQLFGDFFYKMYPMFILLFMSAAIFYFFGALIDKEDATDRKIWITISALTAALHIGFVPLCGETYYWYNGSVYYTGFYALTLFFWGGIIKYIRKPGTARLVLLSLLALVIAGGNYASLLPTTIILFFVTLGAFVKRKSQPFIGLSVIFLLLIAGFAVSILAPGNALRQATSLSMNPIKAIIKSLLQCFGYLVHWTNIYIFIALILLTPAFVYLAKRSRHEFKFPVIICVFFFGIFASSESPTFYAQSNGGAARVFDICFYMMLLCIGFMYYYLVGGIIKFLEKKEAAYKPAKLMAGLMASLAAISVILFALRPAEETFTNNNAIKATASLINGEAAYYDSQYRERMKAIEGRQGEDVTVKAFDVPENLVYFLWLGDLSTESDANSYVAEYFSFNSIRVE